MLKLNVNSLLVGLSLLTATKLHADWPEFRGPSHAGKVAAEDLPLRWSPTENIRWRTELPGSGWSSPIVVGSTIYLTAAVPAEVANENAGYELVALLVDAATGELRKQVPVFQQGDSAPRIHGKNSHASPTPVFDGEHIYLHFGHQGTACMTLAGELLWKNDALGYPPVHGNGGSPIVVGSLLIFSRDGADIAEVTALDKRTGEVAWQTSREVKTSKQFSFCTPALFEIAGKPQLILPGSNVVQSLDPATGKELWRVEYEGYSVIPRPIYESGLVFVCTGYDRPSLLAIDPTGSGDVTQTHVRWQAGPGIAHTPSLIGHNGQVITVTDNGIASCFDALAGEELWKERIGGNFSASPLLVGNQVYLLSEAGVCTVLDISQQPPREIASNNIEERCLASFAVVDGELLLRSDKALYRIQR